MPDPETTPRKGRQPIQVPKPDTEASEDVLRDESDLYGDESDIPVRRRRSGHKKNEPSGDKASTKKVEYPKVAPKRKKVKKRKLHRKRRTPKELLEAFKKSGFIKPITIFGRRVWMWPLIPALLIALLGSSVMMNNSNPRITEQTVTVVGLPEDMEGYRIVVLSDLNGRRFGDSQSLLVRTLNQIKYDALFCVGDMVGKSGKAEPFWELLEGLNQPEKVYFICGDSDPGPYLSSARATEGVLSQLILEDWILGAIERGANYVDAPVCITTKSANLWISPATMLNLEASSTLETWQDQTEQEIDGVRSGITMDYDKLPITTYRQKLAQKLYDAQREMDASDIHIALAHEVPTESFIYTSEDHSGSSERYLPAPELIVAGHYCGGVWRIPLIGAFYVPDRTLERGGWFPAQESVSGLSMVGETQVYITRGLSTNSSVPLMPFRLFNTPEISLLTLTSTLPENMLEAAGS